MRKQWSEVGIIIVGTTLLTTFFGCGKGLVAPERNQGVFRKFVESFQADARKYGVDPLGADTLSIEFGVPVDDKAVAECRQDILEGKKIVIRESNWKTISDDSRESLLFHELGHCQLGRVHRADKVDRDSTATDIPRGGTPVSLMFPQYIPGDTYRKFQDFYLKELFSGN